MKAYIEEQNEKKKKHYKDDYGEMLGDYNREVETIKGYNGRQILELLQNCDDEGAKIVSIVLDSEAQTICISNDGSPFSEKGYRSLFIANLSSKRIKRKYIGNKGLGFRSVINWSNSIAIESNELSLIYSEENRKKRFNELFTLEEQEKIKNEESIAPGIIPMPFLCMPELLQVGKSDFVTTIKIQYKKEYESLIIEQVSKITSETLLFLKSLEQIKIVGFKNKSDIVCTKERLSKEGENNTFPSEKIVFQERSWYVFKKESVLPIGLVDNSQEEEFYQIKIAIDENFNYSSPYLFSFFPTNILLKQPYILHATFDLDATRNQIVDSRKNRFILKEIVSFTIDIAKYYTSDRVSYRALEILNHNHEADSLSQLGYYNFIKKAILEEKIFPCIDNSYKRLAEVIYINDEFARMLQEISASYMFPFHLIPLNNKSVLNFKLPTPLIQSLQSVNGLAIRINKISNSQLSLQHRIWFVSLIVKECKSFKNNFKNQLDLLVDDGCKIISGSEYIYTPASPNEQFKTPSFTYIHFVNRILFESLLKALPMSSSDSRNKSRFFANQLEGYCNIHSYESSTLAQKIVRETNRKVKEDPDNRIQYVREIHSCLFNNFKLMDRVGRETTLEILVPVITKNNEVKIANEVMLSAFYPTGKKTEQIFISIYTNNDYISSPESLGIDINNTNIDEIEKYLLWINVNKFAKYRTTSTVNDTSTYATYIKQVKDIKNSTGNKITYKNIVGLESILSKMEPSKLILWAFFDIEFKQQIDDLNNTDTFYNSYYGYSVITRKPSFIKYLILLRYKYKFYLLLTDEKYSWANDFHIDYESTEFYSNGIVKSNINEILILLGAKDDFNRLSINQVASIINKIPKKFPDGKGSQSFYKKALSHYKINKQEISIPLQLFADSGAGLQVCFQNEVYFSDKVRLPKRLKKDFPIFNFPIRSGGVDAVNFFKIHDLREVDLSLESYQVLTTATDSFQTFFNLLKPLILTYRINEIQEIEQQRLQASICNKIKILLCDEIRYKVRDHKYEVSNYEFLNFTDNTYYIKVDSSDSFEKLRKNNVFSESFADIISLAFGLSSDKNDFKYMIRDQYEEIYFNVKIEFGEDIINEARELLGLADYKNAFWISVFDAQQIPYPRNLDDLDLNALIQQSFLTAFDLSTIHYEDINKDDELRKIVPFFKQISLNLTLFIARYPYQFSLEKYHYRELRNIILSKKNEFKAVIWNHLLNKTIQEKSNFLVLINQFEDYEAFVKSKSYDLRFTLNHDRDLVPTEFFLSKFKDISWEVTNDPEVTQIINLRSFDSDEKFEISQSLRLKSLIYFPDTIDLIKFELSAALIEKEAKYPEIISQSITVKILDSDNLIPIHSTSRNGSAKSNVYNPQVKNNRWLKEIGNTAEELVYKYLTTNNYSEVYRASLDNEGLHYDIRYTDAQGDVKFIEVKNFDSGSFHLSKAQYDFGLQNKNAYEIWLVENKSFITPIKDFFTNDKYEIIPSEYLVYLERVNT